MRVQGYQSISPMVMKIFRFNFEVSNFQLYTNLKTYGHIYEIFIISLVFHTESNDYSDT